MRPTFADVELAGPIVQTIFVFVLANCIMATHSLEFADPRSNQYIEAAGLTATVGQS
jgi:hypothetical protein